MKNKKTLEEVAEKLTNDLPTLQVRFNINKEESYDWFLEALQKGAKWQQERSYSEEDMIAFGEFIFKHTLLIHAKGVKNLFEQFKNK